MDSGLIGVFHSPDRAQCEDRVFMLSAVQIAALIEADPSGFTVFVPAAQAAFANHHLWRYEQEQPRRVPAPPPAKVWPHAWLGTAAYAVVLVFAALAVVRGWWPGAFARGALDAGGFQQGQWWRAVTALTLHWDIVHLVMNLFAGGVFGWLAARQLGAGVAWLLALLAAGLANAIEASVAMPPFLSAGASTAIFALIGLTAAHGWQRQGRGARSWAKRVAPLVAGFVLLGLLGSGGGDGSVDADAGQAGTDLIAHVLGFAMGAVSGVIAAQPRMARWLERIPQWTAGLLALSLLTLSWVFALA